MDGPKIVEGDINSPDLSKKFPFHCILAMLLMTLLLQHQVASYVLRIINRHGHSRYSIELGLVRRLLLKRSLVSEKSIYCLMNK